MRPPNSFLAPLPAGRWAGAAALSLLVLAGAGGALPQSRSQSRDTDFKLSVDVDLVVLHATVVDVGGRRITELPADRFRIYEDSVLQKVSLFRNEDVPLTVGLVLDNSASMTEKRQEMMAGALKFVETSNPLDETFVVNFNDDYYLDLGENKEFTNSIEELKEALEKTRTRGSTSFYDALRASLDHLKKGTRQKKVLLIITDGVDNTSLSGFDTALREAQQAEAALYLVALPCTDSNRECRKAKREIRKLAEATGGMSYFPTSLEQVQALCQQIAHEIRNQYVLGYYPTNRARDGSFRTVRVEIIPAKGQPKLFVRTRPGYYAQANQPTGSQ